MMLRPQSAVKGMGQLGAVATGWSSPDMTQRTQNMLRRSGFPQAQCKESQHTGPFGDLYFTRDCRVVAGQALIYPADYYYSLMDVDGRLQAWAIAQLRADAGADVANVDMATYDATPPAPPLTLVTSGPTQVVVDPWAVSLPAMPTFDSHGNIIDSGSTAETRDPGTAVDYSPTPAVVTLPNGQQVTLYPQTAPGGENMSSFQTVTAAAASNATTAVGGTTTQAAAAATQAATAVANGATPQTAVAQAVTDQTGVSPQVAVAATADQAGLLDQLSTETGLSKAVLIGGAAVVLLMLMRR